MQHTTLGRTGLRVSRLTLGTNSFGWGSSEAESFAVMDAALAGGMNLFDTADVYSRWVDGNQGGESEAIIGKWLKTKNRREVIIATKGRAQMWGGPNGEGLSRAHLMDAVHDSLRRLQTDYIDIYQVHSPDHLTPLEETLRTLDDLIRAGKIRYIGASNHEAWYLMKTLWTSDVNGLARYEVLQPHYNLFHRAEYERELMAACVDQNVGVIPYSSLARGFASGKYTRENRTPESFRSSSPKVQALLEDDEAFAALDVLREIADGHGVPMGQVALAWTMNRPGITSPIVGARVPEQIEELLGASELELTPEEQRRITEATAKY